MGRKRVRPFFADLNHIVLTGIIVQEPKRDSYLVKDSWSMLLSVKDGNQQKFTVRVVFVEIMPYIDCGGLKCFVSGRLYFKAGEMFVVGDDLAIYDAWGRKKRCDGVDW